MEHQTEVNAIKLTDKVIEVGLSNGQRFFVTTDNFLYIMREYFKNVTSIDAKGRFFNLETLLQ